MASSCTPTPSTPWRPQGNGCQRHEQLKAKRNPRDHLDGLACETIQKAPELGGQLGDDQTYLEEPYLSIRWRGVPRILYAEWKGFATSAEFRAALLMGLHAIRERHVVGYVSDARKAKLVVAEDQKWVVEVWLPQAVAAGLKRMAMVSPGAGLGKLIVEDIVKEVDSHGLLMRNFNSVAAATTWAVTGLAAP